MRFVPYSDGALDVTSSQTINMNMFNHRDTEYRKLGFTLVHE